MTPTGLTALSGRIRWLIFTAFVVAFLVVVNLLMPRDFGQTAPTFSFWSGNRLWESCREDSISRDVGYCLGYLMGSVDSWEQMRRPGSTAAICLPERVTIGQIADVVRNELRERPETRHLPAQQIVINSLARRFPCG